MARSCAGPQAEPGAEAGGEKVELENQKETATVRITPSATRTVEWKMSNVHKSEEHDRTKEDPNDEAIAKDIYQAAVRGDPGLFRIR